MKLLTRSKETGFTIVELLVVVVIIAILAAVTIVSYRGVSTQARDAQIKTATQQALQEIGVASVNGPGPYPTDASGLKACQGSGIICKYQRTDYTDSESGQNVYGYSLKVCDASGDIQYTATNQQTSPTKLLSSSLAPEINSQYNIFSSPSMSVSPYFPYNGTIYAYTGQTITLTVTLGPCTPANKTTVQWQYSTNAGSTWTNVAGATALVYTSPTLNNTYDGRYYRVTLTNQYGSVSSRFGGIIMDYEP